MSFIADILGARAAAKGQKQAAQVARDTSAESLAEQRRQYDLSRQDMMPWLNTGAGALGQLAKLYGINQPQTQPQMPGTVTAQPTNGQQAGGGLLGLGGTLSGRVGGMQNLEMLGAGGMTPGAPMSQGMAQPQTLPAATGQAPVPGQAPAQAGGQYDSFWQSPDYQFRLNESLRGLTARNAALGIQDSGAAQRSALGLAGNLASSEYNNYANRIAALAGVGQTAAQNQAQLGSNYANAVTGINQNLSGSLGSSYINRGNIWGNLASNLNGQVQQAGSMIFGGFG